MKIKVYSTPTCPWCQKAKKYLESKKIAYEDIDVSSNQKAAEEMVEISGQIGVPVIIIDEKVIIGFDSQEMDKAIKNHSQ